MNTLEAIDRRRSHRKFDGRPVERAKLDAILHATFTAPSAKNTRTTRLVVVQNRELLEKIAVMRNYGSAFLKDAPAAIVVMGDVTPTDLWRENCAISATILQLAAEELGLGACWVHVHGRPRDNENPGGETAEAYLRTIVDIPADCGVLCIVALGYSVDTPRPRPEADDSDKVTWL